MIQDKPWRCGTFKFPGPPWYAAQCRLVEGHQGDHDFGTVEAASRAYWASLHKWIRSRRRRRL